MADIEKINPTEMVSAELLGDLRKIIDTARSHVASTANYELTAMYWHIGDRINRDVLNNERAEYGKQIVSQVATQLQEEYGTKGFEERTIRRMMQFAQLFPDFQIVAPLARKLSWTHFVISTDSQPRDDRDTKNGFKSKIYDFPCICPKILVPLHAILRAGRK